MLVCIPVGLQTHRYRLISHICVALGVRRSAFGVRVCVIMYRVCLLLLSSLLASTLKDLDGS